MNPPILLNSGTNVVVRHFESLARTRAEFRARICLLLNMVSEKKKSRKSHRCSVPIFKPALPPSPYWLLWVIYATEQGYKYEGDEYWQSFRVGDTGMGRPRIAINFLVGSQAFQSTYDGVVPSGRWG